MRKKIKEIIEIFIITLIFLRNRILRKLPKRKTKEINILFLIGKIANGGAERACVNLAEELSKKYNVTIVVFSEKGNEYKCNVPVINISGKRNSLLRRIVKVLKIKKEKKITHTISFLIGPSYVNVITSRYDKAIISARNYMSESHKNNKKDIKKHKFACKFADKIVSVAKVVEKDQLENWKINKDKSLTITNFIDEEKIINSINTGKIEKEDEHIFENSKVVINVGRLVEQKGQDHLIKAFKQVVKEVPDAKLIILGGGELKQYLENLIKELDLCNNVFLIGFKKNPYIYMAKSKVFVLTSYFEGMSNVMLEAMECGMPVIATNSYGGNYEVLVNNSNEYGILVPVCKNSEDEKVVANEIIRLLKNEELRQEYVNKSKERIKDYSKENIVKQWENLLKE